MSLDLANFQFLPASTVTLAATASSARVRFIPTTYQWTAASHWIRVVNDSEDIVFVEIGGATVAAAVASGIPVLPTVPLYCRAITGHWLAAIYGGSGSGNVYVTPGRI